MWFFASHCCVCGSFVLYGLGLHVSFYVRHECMSSVAIVMCRVNCYAFKVYPFKHVQPVHTFIYMSGKIFWNKRPFQNIELEHDLLAYFSSSQTIQASSIFEPWLPYLSPSHLAKLGNRNLAVYKIVPAYFVLDCNTFLRLHVLLFARTLDDGGFGCSFGIADILIR